MSEELAVWDVGDGEVEVTTFSNYKYYIDSEGFVWGGTRRIESDNRVKLLNTVFFLDTNISRENKVFIGGRMVIEHNYKEGRTLITSVIKGIRRR